MSKSIFNPVCLHFKAWTDEASGNMHMKTVGHFPDEPCTIPNDELPPEEPEVK